MKKAVILKVFLLQLSSYLGLYAGFKFSPDELILTSVPDISFSMLSLYIEMHSYYMAAFCATVVSIIVSIQLRQTIVTVFLSTMFAGILFTILHYAMINMWPYFNLSLCVAFILGSTSCIGLFYLLKNAIASISVKYKH